MPQTHYSTSEHGRQKDTFLYLRMNLPCLSLVLDCSLYTVNIIAKFMLDWVENGFNCETNSWQTRRLLNPLSPPKSRLCTLSSNSTQGFIPRLLCLKKSALLFCLWPTSVVKELCLNLCAHMADELKMKDFGKSLSWTVKDGPSPNKLWSTGEAGWSGLPPHTLQYSKMAHRMNTWLSSGYIF